MNNFHEAHRRFHVYFKRSLSYYMDTALSAAFNKPLLDLIKFDEYLHQLFGDYEADGHSMESIITEHFGVNGASFIRSLI